MSASRRPSQAVSGFSLVELLVALVFISILMAGMTKVFTASSNFFSVAHETMGIQRSARSALNLVQDDLLQAGYLLPPRLVTELIGSTQPALMIETSKNALKFVGSDGVERSLPTNPDEIQLVMDLPLNAEGTLADVPDVMGSTVSVTFQSGGDPIQKGDLLFIQDSAAEFMKVNGDGGSGSTKTFTLEDSSALVDAYGNDLSSLVSPRVMSTHKKGAQVTFVRPLQVVSYTLKALPLDPGNDKATIPCLIRRTKSLTGAWGPDTLLVEGVTGLNIDLSFDGGKTWIRRDKSLTTSQWDGVKAEVNTAFKALTSPLANQLSDRATNGVDSTVDPFWFNYVPLLIRMEVETQTRLQRTEFNAAYNSANPQATYRTRRETLFVSSRNFAQSAP